jgi:hypothetical protein
LTDADVWLLVQDEEAEGEAAPKKDAGKKKKK